MSASVSLDTAGTRSGAEGQQNPTSTWDSAVYSAFSYISGLGSMRRMKHVVLMVFVELSLDLCCRNKVAHLLAKLILKFSPQEDPVLRLRFYFRQKQELIFVVTSLDMLSWVFEK